MRFFTITASAFIGALLISNTAASYSGSAPAAATTSYVSAAQSANAAAYPIKNGWSSTLMICLVNTARAARGVRPLGRSVALNNSAQSQSNYQAAIGQMTHNGSGGSSPGTRITRAGYRWNSCAENIAYGCGSVQGCHSAWCHSPDHYKNLMSSKYTHMGSGGAYRGKTLYATQDFACNGQTYSFPICPSGAY